MNARNIRWFCLLLSLIFLVSSFFVDRKFWAAAGFFGFGSAWYWLARRKTRELDAPRPR